MSVGDVLAKHTSRELAEWQAFLIAEAEDAQQAALVTKATQGVAARKRARRMR